MFYSYLALESLGLVGAGPHGEDGVVDKGVVLPGQGQLDPDLTVHHAHRVHGVTLT